jgi:putative tributyrin esterase
MKRLIMLSLAASALMMLAAVRTEAQGHGTTRGDAFMSQALGVVYYLHGLGGHETDWLAQGAIDAVADSLIGAGMREAIVVMPDGDDSWYSAWVNPPAYETCRDSVLREAAERACVRTFRYDDYIAHDLVSYVDAHYRTRADRAHRGIGGLSMGGYGALKLALAEPSRRRRATPAPFHAC